MRYILLLLLALASVIQLPVAAHAQTAQLFLEDFDAAVPPALPAGWDDPSGVWETSASVSSTGSGLNNLYIQGTAPAALTTPAINLSGLTEGTFSYLARRTSTYDQAALTVLASTDGGATFDVTLLAAGAALPATDGSYQAISMAVPPALLGAAEVVLRFDAAGGSSTGSNVRIDDVAITGTSEGNLFGFSQATGAADASGAIAAEMAVDFRNTEALQGIQFTVSWDEPAVTFVDASPGTAVSDPALWQLSAEASGTSVRVVLLNDGAGGLAEGVYNPVLTLNLLAGPGATAPEVVLTVSDVVSALALPTGDDAGLGIGQATNTVTLPETGAAEFVPSATDVGLGAVAVGASGEAVLTVSNPGGTADLVVTGVAVSNPLFAVEPATATVPPGGEQVFTISFTPTATAFGAQSAVLAFSHNAAGGVTDIDASALGTGGRGDASEDGLVDVVDLVLGIDYVLERLVPSPSQRTSSDVFPFSAPDGALDIRDLTVLAQAIVAGAWPDGVTLPSAPATGPGKQLAQATDGLDLLPIPGEGAMLLHAHHAAPLRALQLSLVLDEDAGLPEIMMEEVARGEAFALVHRAAPSRTVRVLVFRLDGEAIAPGAYPFLRLPGQATLAPEALTYGVAVGDDGARLAMRLLPASGTAVEDVHPTATAIGAPYPNPLRGGAEALHVPVRLTSAQQVRIAVYDVLGREAAVLFDGRKGAGVHHVTWQPGTGGPLAPGVYLVRIEAGADMQVRPLVIR